MPHPIVPKVIEVAQPIAASLGLDVVHAVFQTNQSPPVLRVDVCNLTQDTSLEDCERMSKLLNTKLDDDDIISGHYVLEISSPGVSPLLATDRDFRSFKGFAVVVTTIEPYDGQQEWLGNLVSRDDSTVYLNLKGRITKIPRAIVSTVKLTDKLTEA